MDQRSGSPGADAAPPSPDAEALEFVRFCHRRKRVGWPELYDEMCAVAGRGLYHGYGSDELSAIGIGLGLFQMPAMAGLVSRVVAEDHERRRRTAEAIRTVVVAAAEANGEVVATGEPGSTPEASTPDAVTGPDDERVAADHRTIRFAVAAGA